MALTLADGPKGRADPLFAAHEGPIVTWAMAIWERWFPISAFESLAAFAVTKLDGAQRVWSNVTGPATGVLATMRRRGWKMFDAFRVVTDNERLMDLRIDPPTVITEEYRLAVRRFRWRCVETKIGKLTLCNLSQLEPQCVPSGPCSRRGPTTRSGTMTFEGPCVPP